MSDLPDVAAAERINTYAYELVAGHQADITRWETRLDLEPGDAMAPTWRACIATAEMHLADLARQGYGAPGVTS